MRDAAFCHTKTERPFMSFKFDPDSLTARAPNGEEKFLASWKTPRDGKHADFWQVATQAAAAAANVGDCLRDIRTSTRLSDFAKATDSKERVIRGLRELGHLQSKLTRATEALSRERNRLAAVKPHNGDAALAIVDLALVERLRELPSGQRAQAIAGLLNGSDQRTIDAVLRLPAALHGLTPDIVEAVTARAIEREHPEAVRELQELGQSARTAAQVVSRAAQLIQAAAPLTMGEIANAFGDGWDKVVAGVPSNPDVVKAMARQYAQSAAGEAGTGE